ncbi:MAG: tetratricopeptide repeat protein [Chitinophagaceae bacterium]
MTMKTPTTAFLFLAVNTIAFSQAADSADFYFKKGLEEKNNRRFLPALNHFQKSVNFRQDLAEAQKELGLAAIQVNRNDVAIPAFQKLLTLKKDDPIAFENLANIYFRNRKWNEAIVYAKKMQQLKLGKNSNYIIGKSNYEVENYAEANTYLEAAAKDEPANAEIPYLIGRSYVDMSNYKAAASYMEKAVSLDTTKPRWTYECGLAFGAIPNDKMAIKYYLLAAERGYKTDNDYYENLGDAYIASGEAARGVELLKKVLEKKPSDLVLLYNIAEILYRTGKFQEAIDQWDKILLYDKQNAKALYMIGLAYQKMGDKAKGMQLCDKAISMDPSLANMRQKKMML